MLFNLAIERKFINKGTGEAICCHKTFGPFFGQNELSGWSEPFNGDGKCTSYGN